MYTRFPLHIVLIDVKPEGRETRYNKSGTLELRQELLYSNSQPWGKHQPMNTNVINPL